MRPVPDSVVSLSRGRVPVRDAATQPCPSSSIAVLGVESPTRVRCGLLHGHDGPHIFRIEWTEATS